MRTVDADKLYALLRHVFGSTWDAAVDAAIPVATDNNTPHARKVPQPVLSDEELRAAYDRADDEHQVDFGHTDGLRDVAALVRARLLDETPATPAPPIPPWQARYPGEF